MYYDELYHHGILGQKWGIRRYQNKDGSLTAEGIKRYRTDLRFKAKIDKQNAKREKIKAEAEAKRKKELMEKPVRDLSESEIAERIARLELEKKVADLERDINKAKSDGNNSGQNQNQNQNQNQKQNKGDNNQKQESFAKTVMKKTGKDLLNKTSGIITSGVANYVGAKVLNSILSKGNLKDKKEVEQSVNEGAKQVKQVLNDSLSNIKINWKDTKVSGDYSKYEKSMTYGRQVADAFLTKNKTPTPPDKSVRKYLYSAAVSDDYGNVSFKSGKDNKFSSMSNGYESVSMGKDFVYNAFNLNNSYTPEHKRTQVK